MNRITFFRGTRIPSAVQSLISPPLNLSPQNASHSGEEPGLAVVEPHCRDAGEAAQPAGWEVEPGADAEKSSQPPLGLRPGLSGWKVDRCRPGARGGSGKTLADELLQPVGEAAAVLRGHDAGLFQQILGEGDAGLGLARRAHAVA